MRSDILILKLKRSVITLNILIEFLSISNIIKILKIILILFKYYIKYKIHNYIKIKFKFLHIDYTFNWSNFNSYINNIINYSIVPFKIYDSYKIIYNILDIKNISKVKKGGILRRFSIKTIIGNNYSWVGLGISKNLFVVEALENSYIKAFKNKIYFPTNLIGELIFKNLNYKLKNTKLIINNKNYSNLNKICGNIELILNSAGVLNSQVKVKGNSNINNIITILTNLYNKYSILYN